MLKKNVAFYKQNNELGVWNSGMGDIEWQEWVWSGWKN
jgi:hypothetical protein